MFIPCISSRTLFMNSCSSAACPARPGWMSDVLSSHCDVFILQMLVHIVLWPGYLVPDVWYLLLVPFWPSKLGINPLQVARCEHRNRCFRHLPTSTTKAWGSQEILAYQPQKTSDSIFLKPRFLSWKFLAMHLGSHLQDTEVITLAYRHDQKETDA
jgi:hypothetical protein